MLRSQSYIGLFSIMHLKLDKSQRCTHEKGYMRYTHPIYGHNLIQLGPETQVLPSGVDGSLPPPPLGTSHQP